MTTFQSRFGPQEWLKPYTDKTLEIYLKKEKKYFGNFSWFSSDCVETVEISIREKKAFRGWWGKI